MTYYLLEYKDFFDDEVRDFKEYLAKIGKKDIVKFCTLFVSTTIWGKETVDPKYQIEKWFSDKNEKFSNEIISKLKLLKEKNIKLIVVFNILKIFEFILLNNPEETTISENEFEIQLFKSVLALNQDFNLRDKTIGDSTKDLDAKAKLPCLLLTAAFCDYDLNYFKVNELEISQFIKASLFFKFLETHNATSKRILEEFYKQEQIKDWKAYLKKYMPIFHSILNSDLSKPIDLVVPEDKNFEANCKFLENLIVNNEYTIDDFDFLTCRSKPFFKLDNGKYRIIHVLFVIEKLYNGLYFTMSKINDDIHDGFLNFRSTFCDEFSEKTLVYNVLGRSFPKSFIKLSGQDILGLDATIDAEPDYYVRKKNKVYLFESKDVLIEKKIKQSHDFAKIENGLKTKFYHYFKEGVRKDVGVMQLINNIKRILGPNCPWDNHMQAKLSIYPILLVHYNIYNTPGVDFLVKTWFNAELKKLENEGIDISLVNDVVIVDINTFILNHERFQNKSLCLESLIHSYNKLNDRFLISFSTFVSDYVIKKRYFMIPKLFNELGLNLFN